jgi:hypothetical protein
MKDGVRLAATLQILAAQRSSEKFPAMVDEYLPYR